MHTEKFIARQRSEMLELVVILLYILRLLTPAGRDGHSGIQGEHSINDCLRRRELELTHLRNRRAVWRE
jgi:hypothetical protein